MRWRLGSKGKFDIKYFYGALRDSSSITFPWKSIWGVKVPHHVSFLFRQLHGGRFSQLNLWGEEASLLWIGVAFVNVMGRVLIICSYIVGRYFGYGALLLDLLVFCGFYLRELSTY